jgi:hypothetical protein
MKHEPSRTSMIAFFALCGGAIGGVLFLIGLGLFNALTQPIIGPPPDDLGGWVVGLVGLLFFGVVFGAMIGFVPAIVGGAIYAFLPSTAQRIVIAPLIGTIVSACWAVFLGMPQMFLPVTLAGAASATVCALFARRFGIDHWPRNVQAAAEPTEATKS